MKRHAMEKVKNNIVNRIVGILADVYHEEVNNVALSNLHARLAFKADPDLNELRLALERLERGDFGNCILCKKEIEYQTLLVQPTAHFCTSCTQRFHDRIVTHHLSPDLHVHA